MVKYEVVWVYMFDILGVVEDEFNVGVFVLGLEIIKNVCFVCVFVVNVCMEVVDIFYNIVGIMGVFMVNLFEWKLWDVCMLVSYCWVFYLFYLEIGKSYLGFDLLLEFLGIDVVL